MKVPEMEWMFHDVPSPEEEMIAAEEARESMYLLDQASDSLPQQERQVIEYMYDEGMTAQEVADKLGVTRNRVYQIRDQAMSKLKIKMSELSTT